MGCCSSKSVDHGAQLIEMAPHPVHAHAAPLPNLDRNTLLSALERVAKYIHKKGQHITIVAVGGAVNTILLRSRNATHDVDFFNETLSRKDVALLLSAAKSASDTDGRLEEQWLNNRTVLFIPRNQRMALTQQSLSLRQIVFERPGLTVVAAPWQYAFCCKVDRLAGGGLNQARAYDLNDAVEYLGRYLGQHRLHFVPLATVKEWFAQYSLKWTEANVQVIARVNQLYRQRFRVPHNPIK